MDCCPIERCRREIAAIEAEILTGNTDLQGLCLALSDWSAELRILQEEANVHAAKAVPTIAAAGAGECTRTPTGGGEITERKRDPKLSSFCE